ncbi:MAG TPA: porin [Noviherbaspirillum sp.]|nr:porin [Noviherbaspirillum sp.]
MKKSLLALAVLGAFAGAASAQTNVTVYGVVDVGISRVNDGTDTTWGLTSGQQSGSRLGFKGSEDLGGGLSAIFALESGFNADNGTLGQSTAGDYSAAGNRLFGRQAFVGLQGGFGAVKFGRQYTPMFNALDSIDPFGTGLAGDMASFFNPYDVRMDNAVNYTLPNVAGFNGEVAYGFGERAGSTSENRQLGLRVGYANGPITAVLAYHNAKNAADTGSDKTTFLGAAYDLNVVKVHGAVALNKGDYATPGTEDKYRDYMLGVSAPVGGAGTVMASWQRADDRNSDAKEDLLALGYSHKLSKRTNLYTSFGYGKQDDGVAGTSDVKTKVFNAGVRHTF